jgi:hypothetical protein
MIFLKEYLYVVPDGIRETFFQVSFILLGWQVMYPGKFHVDIYNGIQSNQANISRLFNRWYGLPILSVQEEFHVLLVLVFEK